MERRQFDDLFLAAGHCRSAQQRGPTRTRVARRMAGSGSCQEFNKTSDRFLSSGKFWEINWNGREHTACFKRIGPNGQSQTRALPAQAAAKQGKQHVESPVLSNCGYRTPP